MRISQEPPGFRRREHREGGPDMKGFGEEI